MGVVVSAVDGARVVRTVGVQVEDMTAGDGGAVSSSCETEDVEPMPAADIVVAGRGKVQAARRQPKSANSDNFNQDIRYILDPAYHGRWETAATKGTKSTCVDYINLSHLLFR